MSHNDQPLDPQEKLDVEGILESLEGYRPTRRGWQWRRVPAAGVEMGPFHFYDMSEPLKNSIGLPAAKYFDNIDPQPDCVVSTEIASGRFEDDLRRMRMAACALLSGGLPIFQLPRPADSTRN